MTTQDWIEAEEKWRDLVVELAQPGNNMECSVHVGKTGYVEIDGMSTYYDWDNEKRFWKLRIV